MLRMIGAVIAGLLTGGILIAVVEGISSTIYPLPEGLDMTDRAALASYTMNMQMGAYLFVLGGWLLGAFGGGAIAVIIGKHSRAAIIVGAIFTLGSVANMYMIPHPTWFWIIGVLVFIPAAVAGGIVAMKKAQPGQFVAS